jgi:CubicO group peptidase (beta-lactamase class C family)
LNNPQGVAADTSANDYIADTGNNRVLRETLSAETYSQTTVGSGLSSPSAVAVDGSGNIYIADTSNCQGSTTKYPQNSSHHIIRHLSNYMVN